MLQFKCTEQVPHTTKCGIVYRFELSPTEMDEWLKDRAQMEKLAEDIERRKEEFFREMNNPR